MIWKFKIIYYSNGYVDDIKELHVHADNEIEAVLKADDYAYRNGKISQQYDLELIN